MGIRTHFSKPIEPYFKILKVISDRIQIWLQNNVFISETHHDGASALQKISFSRIFETILARRVKMDHLSEIGLTSLNKTHIAFVAVAKINFDLIHVYKQKNTDKNEMYNIQTDLRKGSWQKKNKLENVCFLLLLHLKGLLFDYICLGYRLIKNFLKCLDYSSIHYIINLISFCFIYSVVIKA